MKNKKNKAFTLIELLIAITIFAVISIAVYATFNSGMSVWRRAKDANANQQRFMLKSERLNRELRQTFSFKDIPFKAENNKVQFPSVVDLQICQITYLFDEKRNALMRGINELPEVLEAAQDQEGPDTELSAYISDIDGAKFSYLIFDLQKNAYVWMDEWKQPILPLAVKLSITCKEKTYDSIVIIPAA